MGHRHIWALALLLTCSCLSTTTPEEPFDSRTNFLWKPCDSDVECGGHFECVCGRCTQVCIADLDCDWLDGTSCAKPSLFLGPGACDDSTETESSICGRIAPEAAPPAGLSQPVATLVSWFDGEPIRGTYGVRMLQGTPSPERSETDVELESDEQTGEIVFKSAPRGPGISFHILGGSYTVGEGLDAYVFETYDSIVLNFSWDFGDRKLRVPLVDMVTYEHDSAGVEFEPGQASLTGHVYWGPGEEIRGGVGCAQVFLDDDVTGMDVAAAQRYLDDKRMPLPAEERTETRQNGGYYFGNLPPGYHTLRVTLDGGATFIAKDGVDITMVREDAWGSEKLLLYQFDIRIDAAVDPTLASCVTPS